MKTARIVLLIVILAATGLFVAVSLTAKPIEQSVQNFDSLVTAALSDYEANAANTDNVNQQQVVAAWAAKDLLTVVGRQNAVIIDNQVEQYRAQDITQGLLRVLVLMTGLLIAAVAVIGLTQRDRRPMPAAAPAEAHVVVPPVPSIQ
jgi:hypothetical protein